MAAAEQLDKEGLALDTITGVDWMAEGQMEVVYDYFHPAKALRVVVRTRIPRDNPEIATIQKVFPGANWHERETHDFFGIRFLGHPNLTPFLLPEDADLPPAAEGFHRVIVKDSSRRIHRRRRAARDLRAQPGPAAPRHPRRAARQDDDGRRIHRPRRAGLRLHPPDAGEDGREPHLRAVPPQHQPH